MHTSLVTGGAGFIGSHVVKSLLELGHNVIVLDDLSGGFEDHVDSRATFVKGSVTDHQLLADLFDQYQFDYVYHLAAYAAEGLSHFIRRFNYTNNLIGSVNLINESIKHKIKCFVFTSSIAVYGAGQVPMREDIVPQPEDPYGVSKLAVEQDLKAAKEMFDLNYIIFRPHNVYGEYQNIGDRYRNVVGIFMNQLMQGKSLSVFGDGAQTRAFSYIGDVAPYIAKSIDTPEAYNEIFNIGADREYSVSDLAKAVMNAMGIQGELSHEPARNEVMHAYSDHSKVKSVFNISESDFATLEVGLQRMADWAKRIGARESTIFSDIEVDEKLPPIWQVK